MGLEKALEITMIVPPVRRILQPVLVIENTII